MSEMMVVICTFNYTCGHYKENKKPTAAQLVTDLHGMTRQPGSADQVKEETRTGSLTVTPDPFNSSPRSSFGGIISSHGSGDSASQGLSVEALPKL